MPRKKTKQYGFFRRIFNSFRWINTSEFLKTFFADALFVLSCVVLLQIVGFIMISGGNDLAQLKPHFDNVNNYVAENSNVNEYENAIGNDMLVGIVLVQSFFAKLSTGLLIFFIGWLILSSVIKGYVYSVLSNRKYGKFVRIFAVYNFIWFIFWMLLILVSYFITRDFVKPALILVELVLLYFLTPIFRSFINEEYNCREVVRKFLTYVLKKSFFLIPSWISIFAIWILVGIVYLVLFKFMANSFGIIISILLVLGLTAWTRYYIYSELKRGILE